MNYYLTGNTIKFSVIFKDWDEQNVDPSIIKFIIYDSEFKKINEFLIGSENKIDIGSYYVLYIPEAEGYFYYEWYAEIDGYPSLERSAFTVRQI